MTRSPLTLTALLAATGLSLLLTFAAPAQAAHIHSFVKSFSPPGGFANPLEVAINQSTGEVYVSDYSAAAVYAFNASGAPDPSHPKLTETDGTTPYPFVNPYGFAVDNSAGPDHGDIYVADISTKTVTQFDPTGVRTGQGPITVEDVPDAGTAQSGGLPVVRNNGNFRPTGVAVASNGDIYVADQSNNVVDRFEPDGTFVSQLGGGQISGPNHIALAVSAHLYVAQSSGLVEFDTATGECLNSCAPIDPAANLGVATDSEGNVYADAGGGGGSKIVEYNASREPIESFGNFTFGRGLAVSDASGTVYVADFSGAHVDVFESLIVPDVTTGAASALTRTTATVAGDVGTAGGGNVTECHFDYVADAAFQANGYAGASTAACSPAVPYAGATEPTSGLSSLQPGTTYHYRLEVENANGSRIGSDRTFTTPPAITALSADPPTNLAAREATLNGSFATDGYDTHYYFEFGPTTSYGQTIPTPAVDGGSGAGITSISVNVAGLSPYTVYHYRIVANNTFGISQSSDQSFRSLPPELPAISLTSASSVSQTAAMLETQIKPGFGLTIVRFDYGPTTSYESRTSSTEVIGTDNLDHSVSLAVAGLSPGTAYHFRAVAMNFSGTTKGPDQIVNTASLPAVLNPAAPIPAPVVAPPSSAPPQRVTCKRGFVRKHNKCVRSHRKPKHKHRRRSH